MALKRQLEADETETTEKASKLTKFESSLLKKALSDSLNGRLSLSQLKRVKPHVLKSLCMTFGLLNDTPDGVSFSKTACMLVLTQWIEQNDDPACDRDICTSTGSFIKVRLFKGCRDYPTVFLREIHAPCLPCGGLNLGDLPFLFNTQGHFEVIDNTTYKSVFVQHRILPRDIIVLLLKTCSYIRVVCKI